MKTGEPVRHETEIWVREDGTVYVRNLTAGMAAVLAALDGEDTGMRWRAGVGVAKEEVGEGMVETVGEGTEEGKS